MIEDARQGTVAAAAHASMKENTNTIHWIVAHEQNNEEVEGGIITTK